MNVEKRMKEIATELNEVASRMSREQAKRKRKKPVDGVGDYVAVLGRGREWMVAQIDSKPELEMEVNDGKGGTTKLDGWSVEATLMGKKVNGTNEWVISWDTDGWWALTDPLDEELQDLDKWRKYGYKPKKKK